MENIKNQYYIRLNEHNKIIKVFSSVFEKAKDTDVLIGEDIGSQVTLKKDKLHKDLANLANIENSLNVINEQGLYQYKYENDVITKISNTELQSEFENLPKPKLSRIEMLEQQNIDLMMAVTELYEMNISV